MTSNLSLIDRLRIERTVWTLDTFIADLPQRSRVSKRREMRANLRAATADVGVTEATRRLGPLRPLAAEYLAAEYGEGRPHPRWVAAIFWSVLVNFALLGLTNIANNAFVSGVVAANPHATGTFHWQGFKLLGLGGDFTFVDGTNTAIGGYFGAPFQIWVILAFILGGRLWRLLPPWRTRRPVTAPDN
jgi:hypothetical protein